MSEMNALRREAWIEAAGRELAVLSTCGVLECRNCATKCGDVIEQHFEAHLATCPPAEPMADALAELVAAARELADWSANFAARMPSLATGGRDKISAVRSALARLESPPGLSAPTGAGAAAS